MTLLERTSLAATIAHALGKPAARLGALAPASARLLIERAATLALELPDLERLLSPRVVWVAMTHASNILGTVDMRIEIGPPIRLSRFDTLLLASDGLFDNLSIEEVVTTMRKGPLHQNVASLVKAAHARMAQDSTGMPSKPDDLTIVAFRLNA